MAAINDVINTTDITDAGGELATASGAIAASTTIKGSVGYGRGTDKFDAADYYKLTVGTTGFSTIKLSGLADDLNLALKTPTGSNLKLSLQPGSADETISYAVSPGTYYVYVYPNGYNQSAYTLNIDLPAASGHDVIGGSDVTDAGGELAKASGAISASATIKGSVGYGRSTSNFDAADYYKLVIGSAGTAEFRLSGLADDLNLTLKDGAGNNIKLAMNTGTGDEVISTSVQAGTYYLHVYPNGVTQSFYDLKVTLPASAPPATSSVIGKADDDAFLPGSQNEDIDGADGLDSIRFDKNAAAYALTSSAGGVAVKDPNGIVHTLKHVERVKFSDKSMAFDLAPDGHAGQAMSLLGVLAPKLLGNLDIRSLMIGLFDQGNRMDSLCQVALNHNLIAHGSSQELAQAVYQNVIGGTLGDALKKALVSFIDTHGQASFLAAVAGLHLNVDLDALQRSGLEFHAAVEDGGSGTDSGQPPSQPPSPPTGTAKVIDLRAADNGSRPYNEYKYDAGDGAYKFVLDMSHYHPSTVSYNNGSANDIIANFGADDSVQILNQSSFTVSGSDTGKDVLFTGYGVAGYENITLVAANPGMKAFYDVQGFNALPVGDIDYKTTTAPTTPPGGSTSGTVTTVALRSTSNGSDPYSEHTFDAANGAFKFVLDMSLYHPSNLSYNNGSANDIILNFGADDSIQLVNQSSFTVTGSDTGRDVLLNALGVAGYEYVTLVGVNPEMKAFYDAAGFNALAVGNLSY